MLLARIDAAIRGRDFLSCVEDDARQRAFRMAPEVLQRGDGASRLVQFPNPPLEGVEYLGGCEDGQDSPAFEKIQQLAALGAIDPTIGSGDQGRCAYNCIQQLVFASIPVLGHQLGRLPFEAAAFVTFSHR